MYEALSGFYDDFLDLKYYGKWLDYVVTALEGRKTGADAGCGTGYFTVELCKRGKEVTGLDVSPEMLRAAFARALREGVKPLFVRCDARKLKLTRPAEFIIAMNDVVNYMADPAPFFRAAAENLLPGGLLLFDVSTPYKLFNVLAGNTFSEEKGDAMYVWQNSPPSKSGYVDMKLTLLRAGADGRYDRWDECQRQYAHDAADLEAALKKCGFQTQVYGGFTTAAPAADEQRIHFAAVKKI